MKTILKDTKTYGWNVQITNHPSFKKPKYLQDYGDYNRGEVLKFTQRKRKAFPFKCIHQAELVVTLLSRKFKDCLVKVVKI